MKSAASGKAQSRRTSRDRFRLHTVVFTRARGLKLIRVHASAEHVAGSDQGYSMDMSGEPCVEDDQHFIDTQPCKCGAVEECAVGKYCWAGLCQDTCRWPGANPWC